MSVAYVLGHGTVGLSNTDMDPHPGAFMASQRDCHSTGCLGVWLQADGRSQDRSRHGHQLERSRIQQASGTVVQKRKRLGMRPRLSLLQLCTQVSQVRAQKSQRQGFFECSFGDPLPGGTEQYGKSDRVGGLLEAT